MRGLLVLEDGAAWRGEAIGRPGTSFGEIVFNTAMSGYQE
ncbi:MAG TPA: carbamoyl-phosphate synthase domain-containing protein, partial [Thermoanaerobaculia bacterium]|nr:carbamoyl-phosphate synthase domain-containing protein [Thermoanaerobaculia bacterium]